MFCKKDALRNFAKFFFFNKVARLFPVNFMEFLRTPFFIEHVWWLLLTVGSYIVKKTEVLTKEI